MDVQGNYTVKGERGGRICANEDALLSFERIGFLRDLEIQSGEKVSFRFRDLNIRAWLRDVGSVLELYVYKACLDAGIFNDIISSAVVRWDEVLGHGSVINEIDVMATRGVYPCSSAARSAILRQKHSMSWQFCGTGSVERERKLRSSQPGGATPQPGTVQRSLESLSLTGTNWKPVNWSTV